MTKMASKRSPLLGAAHIDPSEFDGNIRHRELIERRATHLGGSILFYHDPVQIVRGEGVWLYDETDRQYLDCYNNVASLGHCHPQVVRALTKQAKTLNTHTRYLHKGIIEYAEALADKMPDGLDVCYFVNSGTEANELACRMARLVTGRSGIVTMEHAYHGNSSLIHETSTIGYASDERPPHIEAAEPPNTYQGPFRAGVHNNPAEAYAELVGDAIDRLDASGQGLAAFVCDGIFDSQGVLEAPTDYFAKVYDRVRTAGGVCIADEVQAGLCRTGKWWGFENYGITPDIVTLGKPMGDGHPVAAVVTTREIADEFAKGTIYFNTFGGNPVSMAVGKTVLDICERENIPAHVAETGAYLRAGLEAMKDRIPLIGDVKGLGLFQAIELVRDRESREPAAEIARQLPDMMKDRGVLIGLSGRYGDTLKIRPPLIFSKANADQLLQTLEDSLSTASAGL